MVLPPRAVTWDWGASRRPRRSSALCDIGRSSLADRLMSSLALDVTGAHTRSLPCVSGPALEGEAGCLDRAGLCRGGPAALSRQGVLK